MSTRNRFRAVRVETPEQRQQVLDVVELVYRREKCWVDTPEQMFPESDLENDSISWYLAFADGEPAGICRVLYELPVELYQEYGFDLIDADIDVEAFLRHHKVAEIGRFAVKADQRSSFLIAAALMRGTTSETVGRGFTHYVTDVFEDDPDSPYDFHRRVLGFRTVATHRHGELHTESRRLTMLLDLPEALARLRAKNAWIYRYVTEDWDPDLLERVIA